MPKQFWRPNGGSSLLETTLARLAPLSRPDHTVIVVDRAHRSYIWTLENQGWGAVLFQPSDRGTAVGVLLALLPVLERDAEGVVLLSPSDHGVRNEAQFRHSVIKAASRARQHDDVVLFGATPTYADSDYGWIEPEGLCDSAGLQLVRRFVEKPPASEAERLLASGAVWNAMVVVARASTLRKLFAEHLQKLSQVFEAALTLPMPERARYLAQVYPTLKPADFSRDLVTPARNLLVYTWPSTIGWSDLGTPTRFEDWQRCSPGRRSVSTAVVA